MEHTQVSTPKGYQRKQTRQENIDVRFSEAVKYIKSHLMSAIDNLPPRHKDIIMAIHTQEWRKTYEHLITNH